MIPTGTTGKVWEARVQGELFVAYINNIQETASVLQFHHHKLTMSQTLILYQGLSSNKPDVTLLTLTVFSCG